MVFPVVLFGEERHYLTAADIQVEEQYIAKNANKEVLACLQNLEKRSEPDDFILELLAWYWGPQQPPISKSQCGRDYSDTQASLFDIYPYLFVKNLHYLLLADRACCTRAQGICSLGADPIIHAQDIPSEPWKITYKQKTNDGYRFELEARFNKSDPPHRIRIFLVKESNLWKIKDTVDLEHEWSLSANLEKEYKNNLKKLGYFE